MNPPHCFVNFSKIAEIVKSSNYGRKTTTINYNGIEYVVYKSDILTIGLNKTIVNNINDNSIFEIEDYEDDNHLIIGGIYIETKE